LSVRSQSDGNFCVWTVPENIKKIGANDIKHEKTFNSQFLFRRE